MIQSRYNLKYITIIWNDALVLPTVLQALTLRLHLRFYITLLQRRRMHNEVRKCIEECIPGRSVGYQAIWVEDVELLMHRDEMRSTISLENNRNR